jgi:(p)ppGpp synthase/HD superfamily hydrolase
MAERFTPTFLDGLPLAAGAAAYATGLHAGQSRESDQAPFILHPLEVGALLHNTGHSEVVVAAGILHDTVEDTEIRAGDIADRFGDEVAGLVATMTEDPQIESFEERKSALRRQIVEGGRDAAAIYAADKVAKVREFRAQVTHEPELLSGGDAPGRAKLEHYLESLKMLEGERPDHQLVL